VICPKKGGGRVCEYIHARAIYNVLTQGRTVQKGGSKPQTLPANHTLHRRAMCGNVAAKRGDVCLLFDG